jgi:subtilisin-like proprotein convertase family protein
MDVPDSFIIADVNVDLGILHTWVGDLVVIIEHNATSVTIVDQPGVPALGSFGCDQDNYAAVLVDDEGNGGPIEDACAPDLSSPPNYTPNNPLSAFDGMNAAGIWTITVTDSAGFDTGSLEQWSLHFGLPGPSPCVASGACCTSPTECAVTTPEDCTGVYLGDNTSCSASGPVTVYAADPGLAIPDNGGPGAPAEHTINVPDAYTLTDVEIDLGITHTWQGDLIVEVEHNSTIVVIVDQPGVPAGTFGCDQDNYDGLVIDDQGTGGAIEGACAMNLSSPPNYTPNNPLSVFNGMSSSGDWTIRVSDNAGFDTGTLNHWSLHLHAPGAGPCEGIAVCGNGTVEGSEECDDGNASTDACLN